MTHPGPVMRPRTAPSSLPRRPLPAVARALLAPVLAAVLAACSSGSPPARLYLLRSDSAPSAPSAAAPAATGMAWQLGRVQLPAYLDHDSLLLPAGAAGLQPMAGHRWAEPLRDAVPRLLRLDLGRLLGPDKVWGQPLPAGVQITQQLQVEIQRLEATPARDAVVVQARWTLGDPTGKAPPQVGEAELRAPLASSEPEALVTAHRAALWQLAQRIAATAPR